MGGSVIRFQLNGRPVEVADASPNTTLLDFLRHRRLSLGTKEGCAEGDCGACTVVMLDPDAEGGPAYRAINACLVLLPMVSGRQVLTVEGLQRDGRLHPSQEELAAALGSQCGYCTPGIVMALFEACYRADLDADWKIDDQMAGNLCRCTGYRPIREAATRLAGLRPDDAFLSQLTLAVSDPPSERHVFRGHRWYAPTTWSELEAAVQLHPDHRFVCGGTDLGLDVTKKGVRFPCLVSVERLPGLRVLEEEEEGFQIGAAVPLTDLEAWTASRLPVVARILRYFGARAIKHRATVGGNLCNASPIGDLAPVLIALDASVVLKRGERERRLPLEKLFVSYRRTALRPGEVLARVEVPRPVHALRMGAYKVSRRRELDISAVCAGFTVQVHDDRVRAIRLAYGGMAPLPRRASAVEAALAGGPWTEEAIVEALPLLEQDFQPIDDHRGSGWYRATVARNLLRGFFHETRTERVRHLPYRPSGTVHPERCS